MTNEEIEFYMAVIGLGYGTTVVGLVLFIFLAIRKFGLEDMASQHKNKDDSIGKWRFLIPYYPAFRILTFMLPIMEKCDTYGEYIETMKKKAGK